MNKKQVAGIEKELGISLPKAYFKIVWNHPFENKNIRPHLKKNILNNDTAEDIIDLQEILDNP